MTADTGEHGNQSLLPAIRNARLTAAAVTGALGLQPTREFEAGDHVSSRSAGTRDSSLWLLSSSPDVEAGTELTEHLHRLLAIFEPVTAPLWELVHAGGELVLLHRFPRHRAHC